MNRLFQEASSYYTELFANNPIWSSPYPNIDESKRWAKISIFLSQITQSQVKRSQDPLRILDLGCGRGWLTRLANVYGHCDGIDPVENSILIARKYYPGINFFIGTIRDLTKSSIFKPYDVVLSSEVIEHVENKELFVDEISQCIVPDGDVIITTPRGELFNMWNRLHHTGQPIEEWISEKELSKLFLTKHFDIFGYDRIYLDLPNMSLLNRIAFELKFSRKLRNLGLYGIIKCLHFITAFYQVWWFKRNFNC